MTQRLVFFKFGPGPTMMGYDVLSVELDATDEELDHMAWEQAIDQTESYGSFYLEGEVPDEDSEDYDEHYFTDSDLHYEWAEYEPEKHDMFTCSGSFMDRFVNVK